MDQQVNAATVAADIAGSAAGRLPPAEDFFPQVPFRAGSPVYFMHVPKCAGTSIRAIFESGFDGRRLFPSGSAHYSGSYMNYDRVRALGEDMASYDAVIGHFGSRITAHLRADTNVFAWLREPRDNLLSAFLFFIVQRPHRIFSEFQDRARGGEPLAPIFMDWLRGPPGFSRYLGGIVGARIPADLPLWQAEHPGMSMRDVAVQALRRMFFIGLQEDYERSLDALCAITGILPPRPGVRRNVGTKRQLDIGLTEDQKAEFEEIVAPDVQYYELVREIYARQMETLKSLARERPALAFIGDREGLRRHLLGRMARGRAQVLSQWDAWDPVMGENLDNRESRVLADGSLDRWRWTGPNSDSHLHFRLPRRHDIRLHLRLNSATPPRNVEATSLRLSGVPVPVEVRRLSPEGFELIAEVKRSVLRRLPQVVDIELHTSVMLDETDLGQLAGARKLGVALQSIAVEPRRFREKFADFREAARLRLAAADRR